MPPLPPTRFVLAYDRHVRMASVHRRTCPKLAPREDLWTWQHEVGDTVAEALETFKSWFRVENLPQPIVCNCTRPEPRSLERSDRSVSP